MEITPFILGKGRAGQAIWEAIHILRPQMKEHAWNEPVWVERNAPLIPAERGISIAFIANPNALHAERIVEAHRAGFAAVATEKPACVNETQADVRGKTAVLHVYRQMWGPQTLKEMIERGEFGEIISIEGRYWQSSTAERALIGKPVESWKNDVKLSGPSDALLDVGTHWVDMAVFLMGQFPTRASGWASYVNSEAPHRDTHVHLTLEFPKGKRALTSISKTFHGATNHFEINVIGSKGSATWTFLQPDEIFIGQGRDRRVLTRKTSDLGSHHSPFHATGWLEGYIEIIRQLTLDVTGSGPESNQQSVQARRYPELHESVRLVSLLLNAQILR